VCVPPGSAPAQVECTQGTEKFDQADVGKGYYEVIGTLQANGTITQLTAVRMGDNFDISMYAEMVALSHQFPDIF
jgi:hypothetical protein